MTGIVADVGWSIWNRLGEIPARRGFLSLELIGMYFHDVIKRGDPG